MRAIVRLCAAGIVGLGSAGVVQAARAADLSYDHYTGRRLYAPYFGAGEPWSTAQERPPRKGRWYFTQPVPPTVNFLAPLSRGPAIAPYTPAWYDYCARRWDSFDPRTGTVLTPDGERMCF